MTALEEACCRSVSERLGDILWSPNQGDIPLQMGLQRGMVTCPLASEIQNGGAKLALQE